MGKDSVNPEFASSDRKMSALGLKRFSTLTEVNTGTVALQYFFLEPPPPKKKFHPHQKQRKEEKKLEKISWVLCQYPHQSRDSVSPLCVFFPQQQTKKVCISKPYNLYFYWTVDQIFYLILYNSKFCQDCGHPILWS